MLALREIMSSALRTGKSHAKLKIPNSNASEMVNVRNIKRAHKYDSKGGRRMERRSIFVDLVFRQNRDGGDCCCPRHRRDLIMRKED